MSFIKGLRRCYEKTKTVGVLWSPSLGRVKQKISENLFRIEFTLKCFSETQFGWLISLARKASNFNWNWNTYSINILEEIFDQLATFSTFKVQSFRSKVRFVDIAVVNLAKFERISFLRVLIKKKKMKMLFLFPFPVVIQLLNLDRHFSNNNFHIIKRGNKLHQNCKGEVISYAIVCKKRGLIYVRHVYEKVSVRFEKYRYGIKNLQNYSELSSHFSQNSKIERDVLIVIPY